MNKLQKGGIVEVLAVRTPPFADMIGPQVGVLVPVLGDFLVGDLRTVHTIVALKREFGAKPLTARYRPSQLFPVMRQSICPHELGTIPNKSNSQASHKLLNTSHHAVSYKPFFFLAMKLQEYR
jgi:hypothetical protein